MSVGMHALVHMCMLVGFVVAAAAAGGGVGVPGQGDWE